MIAGTTTMPAGFPRLTIGWDVIEHASQWLVQPNGPKAGQPWQPTDSQARWLAWWYAVNEEGRWLFHHGSRRLAKGSGKSPFGGVQAIEELIGPVLLDLDRFDGTPDSCFGRPVDLPLVQIAATAESQTANTMRMVRAMLPKGSRVVRTYGLDVGKTVIYAPNGGQLQIISSSAAAAEGALVTFAIMDETEHWTPATGGLKLATTLDRNLGKLNHRAVETSNAWEPGAGSVAERTYGAWQAQQEGRTRGTSRILYDARIAPADVDLRDEASLDAALAYVYEDCEWITRRTIRERIWDPRTPADVSRRFYLNQPTAAVDAWVTPMEWEALRAVATEDEDGNAVPARTIADEEDIVLFFDGSKSRDATGLVGCAMSDGHIFTVGSWEPNPNDPESVVPVADVDLTVELAFEHWNVWAFFADVQEWESFVKVSWPDRFKDRLRVHAVPSGKDPQAIAWDMRTRDFDFTAATELTHADIIERQFTHDGNPALTRHVTNARRRNGRYGTKIGKESKDSPKKIDLAVCMIGARMVRRLVLASPAWKKRRSAGRGRAIVL